MEEEEGKGVGKKGLDGPKLLLGYLSFCITRPASYEVEPPLLPVGSQTATPVESRCRRIESNRRWRLPVLSAASLPVFGGRRWRRRSRRRDLLLVPPPRRQGNSRRPPFGGEGFR
ncbi:hypothetical protein U1Q18_007245 [Sarracenia purpurea var. burkii]